MVGATLKLTIEYDGSTFSGWQKQPGVFTVQGELERALCVFIRSRQKKCGMSDIEISDIILPCVEGSGRTDAGVHANGQVASVKLSEELFDNLNLNSFDAPFNIMRAINGIAHRALRVKSAEFVQGEFHARHSPHYKCYRYRLGLAYGVRGLNASRVWNVGRSIDIPKMIEGASLFKGKHNFSAFRAADCNANTTERTILTSEIVRVSQYELVYVAHGTGFLKQMIRIIVGTLVELGQSRRELESIVELLQNGQRQNAGVTAPAHGLTLEWVKYF